jgi:type IV pilus assembly protein PilF
MEDSTGDLGDERVSRNKGASDIYVQLAVAYLREGQMDVALKQAKKAVDIDPTSVDARNILALVYDRLGESTQAEIHFKAGIQAHPKDPYIRNAYGTMLCRQNRYEEANVQFQAALQNPLYKTPEVALTNAGICDLARNDRVQAEVNLRRALQLNPLYSVALMEMAKLSYENGEYLSSRAYLQRYLAVASHTPASLWLGIIAETQLGDQDAVASYSLMLRNQFPDSQEVQLLREWEGR